MSHDMIKLQLSQHLLRDKNILSRDIGFLSRRSDIMLWLLHIFFIVHALIISFF